MRRLVLLSGLAACGGDDATFIDAATDAATDGVIDGATDAAADDAVFDASDAPTDGVLCDPVLLTGGANVTLQDWTVHQLPTATLTYGADYTELVTSTGGSTSGQLLLSHAALPAPYTIEVEAQVVAVNNHNQFDAAVALLGAFTPSAGSSAERAAMLYVDGARFGWADDTQQFAANALDGAYHVYRLSVDAAGNATVSRDGIPALSRAGYPTAARLAIGDQTNDPNVDATLRIRTIRKLCP